MKILYLAQCIKEPSGGTKVMYQHVDLLNEMGYDAAIWHPEHGFRYDKFKNETRIVYDGEFWPDVVVSAPVGQAMGPFKRVIFDQNPYYMGRVANEPVNAFMVVSEDSRRYIEFKHQGARVEVIPNYVDPIRFPLREKKERLICMDGRKNWEDMEQVVSLIGPHLDGWELKVLNDMTEEEVSANLQRAAIFLQFGLREGLALMPLEALSCGCRVIGYNGQSAAEYEDCDIWDKVPTGDIVGFCETILKRMREIDAVDRKLFHEFVHSLYSKERTMKALDQFYRSL